MTQVVRWLLATSAVVLAVVTVAIATTLHNDADLVRLRNALLFHVAEARGHAWTPRQPPADFLAEKMPPPAQLRVHAQEALAGLTGRPSELEKAFALARHLAGNRERHGERIQKRTLETYQDIITRGAGYCADYTQVFNALALAADVPVREWGMSFDGYGGQGHAFNEVYDTGLDKWVFIDSFFSLYATDPAGRPLSAAELWAALKQPETPLRMVPILPEAFGFRSPARAITYYRRGVDSFFLLWGNNVFSYDASIASRLFGPLSRSAEQLATMATGVYPQMRIFRDMANPAGLAELTRLRMLLVIFVTAAGTCMIFAVALLYLRRREARGDHARTAFSS